MGAVDLVLARPLLFGAGFAAFAALALSFVLKARRNPINDICTDPSTPVEFVLPSPTGRSATYNAKFASLQRRLYPSLRSLELAQDVASWPFFLAACKALASVLSHTFIRWKP